MQKLLQVLGAAALIGWTVLGAAAWAATRGQVHVVLSAEDPADGPDPAALLADQVAMLQEDLGGLTATLGANFSILDRRVSDSLARAERPAADGASERELRARIAELEARLFVLESAWRAASTPAALPSDDLATSPAAPPVAAAEHAGERPTAAPDPGGAAPARTDTAAADQAAAAAPEPAHPEAPAPKASFLAFRLPSQSFERDARRRWTILGSLSRVGFDAQSSLHDFTGATSAVSGELVANPARPGDRPTGRMEVDATTLDTSLDDRDAAMHEHLASDAHPTFAFEVRGFEPAGHDAEPAAHDGVTRGTVRGAMTIRGVSRELGMPVDLRLDESHRLLVEGSAPLRLSDYGVPVPNKLGLVKMEDEVQVWITLRARPGAEVE
jgi:polyisoprenoid-binding protein YceI